MKSKEDLKEICNQGGQGSDRVSQDEGVSSEEVSSESETNEGTMKKNSLAPKNARGGFNGRKGNRRKSNQVKTIKDHFVNTRSQKTK